MTDFEKYNHIPGKVMLTLHKKMLLIRLVSESIRERSLQLELKCPVHFSLGQEATSAGIGINVKRDDFIVSTYRSHAPYLAKEGSLKKMIAEICYKKGGSVGGTGGSMHLSSPENNLFCTAIVGGSLPIAVGLALSNQMQGKENVAVAFFGDGASEEGSFHESLNFASLKKLPVIFFCENNFYAVHAHIKDTKANQEIYKIAAAHNIPAVRIDGNNVLEIYEATKRAIERARKKQGPYFIETLTYRWLEHVGPRYDHLNDDGLCFRSRDEVENWINRCPIKNFEEFLMKNKLITRKNIDETVETINEEIEEAWAWVKNLPYPKFRDFKACQ